jgi:hypothetical protein
MKKLRILVLAAIVATSMMGVGYAAWTDSFQTTSTINTGELEVKLTSANSKIVVDYSDVSMKDLRDNTVTAKSQLPTVDAANQNITYSFDNLYPGTHAITYLTAKNIGTMPAAIQKLTVTLTDNKGNIILPVSASALANAMTVDYSFAIKNSDNGITRDSVSGTCNFLELPKALSDSLVGKYLLPDEELTAGDNAEFSGYWVQYNLPANLLDAGELNGVSIDVDFDFVQHNLFK